MDGSSQALLIRNARFMDRAGPADILIEAGRIAAIGPGLAAPPAARMIDARAAHVRVLLEEAFRQIPRHVELRSSIELVPSKDRQFGA